MSPSVPHLSRRRSLDAALSPPGGTAPQITGAPAGLAYGESGPLRTPDAAEITSVVLLRTPSPQHVMDPDQRGLSLSFTRTSSDTPDEDTSTAGITQPALAILPARSGARPKRRRQPGGWSR
jgi:hypothetical protein